MCRRAPLPGCNPGRCSWILSARSGRTGISATPARPAWIVARRPGLPRVRRLGARCMASQFSLMDSAKKRVSERLTAEEEKDIARAIRRAEVDSKEQIKGIHIADDILKRKPDRAERT